MDRNDPQFQRDPNRPLDAPLDQQAPGYKPSDEVVYAPREGDLDDDLTDKREHGKEALGAGAGVLGGAAIGMAVGGPPGAVIGGAIGGVAGAVAGEASEGHDVAGAGAGSLAGGVAGAAVGMVVGGPPGAVVGGAVGAGAGAGVGDKAEEDLEGQADRTIDRR